jgi:iron(III) transport system ATP-binding protein
MRAQRGVPSKLKPWWRSVSSDTRRVQSASTVTTLGTSTPILRCANLDVSYNDVPVLQDITLDVEPGQLVALLGASGSGKSTLLHAIAGLVEPRGGEIWISGQRVVGGASGRRQSTPPEVRDVGMVFQNFALWPHLRVVDTVAYPLRRCGHSRHDARAIAVGLLDGLGIGHVAEQRPSELSGGEQQRVGLARALAREARLYLLDEPTAHLDTHVRTAFQESVLARRSETGAAIIYATHDAAEALAIADGVAVIEGGRLIQFGTPVEVYAQPVNTSAADLSGPCSVLSAQVRSIDEKTVSVELGGGPIAVAGSGVVGTLGTDPRRAAVVIRPDWVTEGGPLRGQLTLVAFRGTHTDYHVESDGQRVMLQLPGAPCYVAGDRISFTVRRVWVVPSGR